MDMDFSKIKADQINNVDGLISTLREFGREKVDISSNLFLENLLSRILRELGRGKVNLGRPQALGQVVGILESLNGLGREKVNQILGSSLKEIEETTEKVLDKSVLPTGKIKELVEEYNRMLEEGISEKAALEKLCAKYKGVVSESQISTFIARQREIFEKTLRELNSVDKGNLDTEEIKLAANKISREALAVEVEVEKELTADGRRDPKIIARELGEIIREATVNRVLNNEEASLATIKEVVRLATRESDLAKYETGWRERAEETRKVVEAEVKTEVKVREIAKGIVTNLADDAEMGNKIAPFRGEIGIVVAREVKNLVVVGAKGRDLNNPILKLLAAKGVPQIDETKISVAIRKAEVEVDRHVEQNWSEVSAVRKQSLADKIEAKTGDLNQITDYREWRAVRDYADLVAETVYPKEGLDGRTEGFLKDGIEMAQARGNNPGSIEEAVGEFRTFWEILRRKPEEVKAIIADYKSIKSGLENIKLPFGITEVRAMDGLVRLMEESPEFVKMMAFAQQYMGAFEKINGIGAGILSRLGLKEAGIGLATSVGGQAMGEFVKHSLVVMAENGAGKGMWLILKGVVGGGVKAGVSAAGAGASGAVAAAVAAFQAIPVVGQVILVGALALGVIVTVVKPVINMIKSGLQKIGGMFESMNFGIKDFFQDNFGKFFGGIMNFGFKLGAMIVAIPTIIITAKIMIAPIVIGLLGGTFLYTQFMKAPLIGSLVPRINMSSVAEELGGSNFAVVNPIFNEDCQKNVACSMIEFLHANGVQRAAVTNVTQVAMILHSWRHNFSNFDMEHFVNYMVGNTYRWTYFQCLGFSLGLDKNLPSKEIAYLVNDHPGCVKVHPSNVGVGDHIMYPNGPHIMYLSVLRPDRSFVISHVNVDYRGAFVNTPGSNIDDYLAQKMAQGKKITILRCN